MGRGRGTGRGGRVSHPWGGLGGVRAPFCKFGVWGGPKVPQIVPFYPQKWLQEKLSLFRPHRKPQKVPLGLPSPQGSLPPQNDAFQRFSPQNVAQEGRGAIQPPGERCWSCRPTAQPQSCALPAFGASRSLGHRQPCSIPNPETPQTPQHPKTCRILTCNVPNPTASPNPQHYYPAASQTLRHPQPRSIPDPASSPSHSIPNHETSQTSQHPKPHRIPNPIPSPSCTIPNPTAPQTPQHPKSCPIPNPAPSPSCPIPNPTAPQTLKHPQSRSTPNPAASQTLPHPHPIPAPVPHPFGISAAPLGTALCHSLVASPRRAGLGPAPRGRTSRDQYGPVGTSRDQ